ncbi:MAG: NYN domain-containing protein [Thauera sp.]|nr:NYN domain-containing protein [Thauera sp.]
MKSALFVDFDNVYSGLRKLDPAIADRFARQPLEWVNWVIGALELPDHAPAGARRRLLVRRCYLNPQAYQRFRPSFNLAGFEIIDCPALTSEGKTSTDIHMVLDIIDLLQHEARYDEFIVFSADADFTPVLRKLRRWDRRTTVLAIGFPSAAYRASADLLIDPDEFVRNALGFGDEDEAPATTAADADAEGPSAVASARAAQAMPEAPRSDSPAASPVAPIGPDALDRAIAEVVATMRDEVARAAAPVPCSRLASLITTRHPVLAADWNGKGSFRKFVDSLELAPLRFDWSNSGGFVFDPARSGAGMQDGNATPDWGEDQDILPLAMQIHEVSGVPLLGPAEYRALFSIIEDDAGRHPFDLKETGKRVRDRLREAGHGGSRLDVNWILRGLLMRGHAFGEGQDRAAALANKTANNVRSLCLREQMILDRAAETAIARWFGTHPTPARSGQ